MFTKKVNFFRNKKRVSTEVKLKDKELIEVVEKRLKEKVINEEASPKEIETLGRLMGHDVDTLKVIKELIKGIGQLVENVAIIAQASQTQALPVVTKEEVVVE